MKVPEKRKLNGRRPAVRSLHVLLAFVLVALLGLLATQTASGALFVPRSQAAAGDEVTFRISHTEPGDEYRLSIGDKELVKDVDQDGDQVESKFTMPNLGDTEQTVTVDSEVIRVGHDPIRDSRTIRYVLAGPTGPTTPVEAVAEVPPAAIGPSAPAVRKPPAPKANTGPTGNTKSKSKSKSKSKKEGSSKKDDSPAYVAPKVDSPLSLGGGGGGGNSLNNVTPPVASVPDGAGPQLRAPVAPVPSAPPPGIAGAGGVTATPPPTAPVAPTAVVDNTGNNGFDLPFWLVAVLGLLMIAGLGGAEARLLGLWGTPIAGGHSPDEARLLALARASRSGATVQEGIATRKGVRGNGAPAGKNGSRLKV